MSDAFHVSLSSIVRQRQRLGLPDRLSPIRRAKAPQPPARAKPLRKGQSTLPPLKSIG